MPDVLVNLQSGGQRIRFLKLRAALEVGSEDVATRVEALMPRIMDSFQLYLRALTVEEVSGSGGLQRLKEELAARVNYAVQPTRVDDVLVKEMLVQ
ncbi:MAG: flagellar basal body-associated FliL family protein [Geminicoccaceae bacterium]